jgi:hypothetical protein
MDLIFHGPLGMELSLDRSAGVPRVKAAEHDSPALLVVGRALTAIEGVPVGEIRDKKSWLAVVAKLQAPERPLSLTFEAPAAPPPEEDPVAAEERARAEAEAAAAASAPPRGRRHRSRSRSRSRSPRRRRESSPPRRPRSPSPPALGQRPTRRHLVAAAESTRELQPPVESEPAGRGLTDDYIRERIFARALARGVRDYQQADAIQSELERAGVRIWIGAGEADSNGHDLVKWSTADGRSGPRPPGDAEIYDMVLAREKAKLAKDFASADRIQAEMAASGFTVVYRDATGRPDKRRGAVTWFTVDGRSGPPALSTADIESRLRAWLHARRDVEQNPSRARDLHAECAARGIGTGGGHTVWFTVQGQGGPMPSLEGDAPAAPPVPREAPVGLCPPDDVIRQRLVERASAKLQRDFRRADAIQADLKRAGVELWDVAAQVQGLVRWTTTDGRSGPKPPSDSEIYDMMLAFEKARDGGRIFSETIKRMVAEMTASGVVGSHFDITGTRRKHGALRWCCVDGRTGPPKMSEREIEARLREWARDSFRRSDELRAELAARGVRVDQHAWFTAGPGGLSGPMPSLHRNRSRSRSRSRRRRRGSSRSRSRSPRRSRYDTALPAANHYGPAPGKRPRPPSPPGLGQRPTRRHLVAAAPAPSEASSSDGF